MGLSIVSSLTIIAAIAFTVKEKRLHLFEFIFLWMVSAILIHTFITLAFLNWEVIRISGHLIDYWAFVLFQIILSPLVIIWAFDHCSGLRSRKKRIIAIFIFITFIVVVENLLNLSEIIHYVQWNLFFSYAKWIIIILFTFVPWRWFKNILHSKE